MIPAAFRILYPSAPVVPASTVEQQDTGPATASTPGSVSEHLRLSADTAGLWRQLAARLGGMA